MFLKHDAENNNQINLVAPTGFEPVFEQRLCRRCPVLGEPAGPGLRLDQGYGRAL